MHTIKDKLSKQDQVLLKFT